MDKFYYCLECNRIFKLAEKCLYCNCEKIKSLNKKSPINVIGSKLKGRVLDARKDTISVLFIDQDKNKIIKQFEADKIRKVL